MVPDWLLNGCVDQEFFYFWLKEHFLSNAVSRRALLLLLDCHSSHFEPNTIEFAKKNDIIIFCIPPHTTHECQPLDCSFFLFFEDTLARIMSHILSEESWQNDHFCTIFKPAWHSAANPSNIIGGFRKIGVFPFIVLLLQLLKVEVCFPMAIILRSGALTAVF